MKGPLQWRSLFVAWFVPAQTFLLVKLGRSWWKTVTVQKHKGFTPCWKLLSILNHICMDKYHPVTVHRSKTEVKSVSLPGCFYLLPSCISYYDHLCLYKRSLSFLWEKQREEENLSQNFAGFPVCLNGLGSRMPLLALFHQKSAV